MKKLLPLVLVTTCILLVACGKSQSKKELSKTTESSQTTSKTSQKKESETTVTSETKAETTTATTHSETESKSSPQAKVEAPVTEATDASYNGYYYSVQGKYGPIIIVNKKHPLSPSYGPGEDPTAVAAFRNLMADMRAQGFAISSHYSGFRSYETQASVYNSYVAADGQANADRYSARPGHSEHQTGLAFDFMDSNTGGLLEESRASSWLAQNAHRYGFIVRYLPGKEYSTGYMAESWHVRYIGQEATDIYQSGLTLEEYLGVSGGDYAN